MNEWLVISEDYSLLPINIKAPSFAISNNCKQLTLMTIIVLLTTGKCLAVEGNGFVNRCMLLCKYTIYSSFRCITFNMEWFGKVWQGKNRMAT